jgi:hypothetical protein
MHSKTAIQSDRMHSESSTHKFTMSWSDASIYEISLWWSLWLLLKISPIWLAFHHLYYWAACTSRLIAYNYWSVDYLMITFNNISIILRKHFWHYLHFMYPKKILNVLLVTLHHRILEREEMIQSFNFRRFILTQNVLKSST